MSYRRVTCPATQSNRGQGLGSGFQRGRRSRIASASRRVGSRGVGLGGEGTSLPPSVLQRVRLEWLHSGLPRMRRSRLPAFEKSCRYACRQACCTTGMFLGASLRTGGMRPAYFGTDPRPRPLDRTAGVLVQGVSGTPDLRGSPQALLPMSAVLRPHHSHTCVPTSTVADIT